MRPLVQIHFRSGSHWFSSQPYFECSHYGRDSEAWRVESGGGDSVHLYDFGVVRIVETYYILVRGSLGCRFETYPLSKRTKY